MNEKNKNLVVRVVSAVTLSPLLIVAFWAGGFWTAALLAFSAAVGTGEYYNIVAGAAPGRWWQRVSPPGLLGIAVAGAMPPLAVWQPQHAGAFLFWTVGVYFAVAWTFEMFSGPTPEGPTRVAHHVTGLIYVATGISSVAVLRVLPNGFLWVLVMLIATWFNDSAAYFAGRALGRHKLYPAVSPNKTWEGFAGGFVGAIGGMLGFRALFFPELTVLDCFIVGTAGSILGPIGDLCESMLKRAYQVKDSGKVIPGHGGLLDRVDAVLFNAPMVLLYVQFVRDYLNR